MALLPAPSLAETPSSKFTTADVEKCGPELPNAMGGGQESHKKGWHSSHMRDQFQRNALSKGYENSNDDDLIMISDIDEIPNPNKISEFNINIYSILVLSGPGRS